MGALVVAAALVLLSVVAVGVRPAAAVAVEAAGESADIDLQAHGYNGLLGYDCNGSAAIIAQYADTTYEDPTYEVRGTLSCRTKRLQGDKHVDDIELRTTDGACSWPGSWTSMPVIRDLDDESDRDFAFEATPGTSDDCFETSGYPHVVTQVCLHEEGGSWVCGGTYLVPPPNPAPGSDWYDSGTAGCTSFTPLEPWVSAPEAVAVSGGWAWRSTVTINATYTDPPAALGAYAPTPRLVASVSAAGGVPETLNPDTGSWQSTPGPQAGTWIADAFYTFRSPGGWTADQSRSIRYTGPTLTGAVGSQPPNWQWRGAGLYWGANTITANTSTHPESHSTRPTLDAIAGDSGEYAAHHDPERCHFWWGTDVWPTDTSGYDTPGGPLVIRDSAEPPEPGSGPADPPVVEVDPGGGCSPEATVCVIPPGDTGGNPSVPDPEDESCDFSISDPSTWGGQIICAISGLLGGIADIIGNLLGAIGDLAAALAGLVGALLEGLLDLLLSLFIPDEFPDFAGFGIDLPDGWVGGAPDFGDPGCGPITLPAIELGPLVPSTSPTTLVDTCDDPWPLVRGVVYYGVLAVALISIAQRAVLMVLDALGMGIAVYDAMPEQDKGGRK